MMMEMTANESSPTNAARSVWSDGGAAEAADNLARTEAQREQLLLALQPEFVALRDAIETYLVALGRPHSWSTYLDEGIVALRLRVAIGDAGLPSPTPGLTYWITEGDEGYLLFVDQVDADRPTDFAERTVRVFPIGRYGIKRIEHLIIAQIRYGRPPDR
jgi:hypothetical protein